MLLGMSVAFKQLVPEHALPAPGVTLRAKDVPLLSVAATATLLALLDGLPSAVYATAGWYTAWVYLRFYQVRATGGGRGAAAASDLDPAGSPAPPPPRRAAALLRSTTAAAATATRRLPL